MPYISAQVLLPATLPGKGEPSPCPPQLPVPEERASCREPSAPNRPRAASLIKRDPQEQRSSNILSQR